jgi:hypothetical protein
MAHSAAKDLADDRDRGERTDHARPSPGPLPARHGLRSRLDRRPRQRRPPTPAACRGTKIPDHHNDLVGDVSQLLREHFRPEGLDGIKAHVSLGICSGCHRPVVTVRMGDHKRWTPEHGPAWSSRWTSLVRDGERELLPAPAGAAEQGRVSMADRSIPEPPQPDPERLAEERKLARSARLAGLAVQRAADLGRLLGGQKPDGYTLDQLDHLADTLKGWGIRTAFGTGDTDLIAELTGRRWTQIHSLDDVARLWRQQHPEHDQADVAGEATPGAGADTPAPAPPDARRRHLDHPSISTTSTWRSTAACSSPAPATAQTCICPRYGRDPRPRRRTHRLAPSAGGPRRRGRLPRHRPCHWPCQPA